MVRRLCSLTQNGLDGTELHQSPWPVYPRGLFSLLPGAGSFAIFDKPPARATTTSRTLRRHRRRLDAHVQRQMRLGFIRKVSRGAPAGDTRHEPPRPQRGIRPSPAFQAGVSRRPAGLRRFHVVEGRSPGIMAVGASFSFFFRGETSSTAPEVAPRRSTVEGIGVDAMGMFEAAAERTSACSSRSTSTPSTRRVQRRATPRLCWLQRRSCCLCGRELASMATPSRTGW